MPKASLPGSAGPLGGVVKRWVERLWPAAVKALFQAICGPVMRAPHALQRYRVSAVVDDAHRFQHADLFRSGDGRAHHGARFFQFQAIDLLHVSDSQVGRQPAR